MSCYIDIPDGTVLDGEIIVSGDEDKPDFEVIIARFLSSKTDKPLIERKMLLQEMLTADERFVYVKHFEGQGPSCSC